MGATSPATSFEPFRRPRTVLHHRLFGNTELSDRGFPLTAPPWFRIRGYLLAKKQIVTNGPWSKGHSLTNNSLLFDAHFHWW